MGSCSYGKCFHRILCLKIYQIATTLYQFYVVLTLSDKWVYITFSSVCFLFKKQKKEFTRWCEHLVKFFCFPMWYFCFTSCNKCVVASFWKSHPAQPYSSLFLHSPQSSVSMMMKFQPLSWPKPMLAPSVFPQRFPEKVLYLEVFPAISKSSPWKISWVIYFPSLHLPKDPLAFLQMPL